MKNIQDLQDELSTLFGALVSDMTTSELNLIMAFILTNFAMDFPEAAARIYKLSMLNPQPDTLKIYLPEINENLLEIKFVVPLHTINRFMPNILPYDVANPNYFMKYYDFDDEGSKSPFLEIAETVAIQLANDFMNKMTMYYIPKKPMILSDDTSEYFVINKDSIVIYLNERILDINNIPEHIYSVLRYYAYAKFIDFIVNKSFANMMDMNERIFQMMYEAINQDLSSGDFEGVQSVSLGPLSVSFNNKINNYGNSLSSLGNNLVNPNFLNEMNKQKDKYQKMFKRKKNVFYNQAL